MTRLQQLILHFRSKHHNCSTVEMFMCLVRTEASICCNDFCLWWWWRCRLKCEALTDVCGIQAGRNLNTLQRSLIWLRFPIQDSPNMLFPGHNIYADCKTPLMCTEQNCKGVLCKRLSLEEGKVKEDYPQNFPHSPFCLPASLSTVSCLPVSSWKSACFCLSPPPLFLRLSPFILCIPLWMCWIWGGLTAGVCLRGKKKRRM